MSRLVYFPIALFFCFPFALAEAATNKCTDGRRITYANVPCEEMGLKSAGPVKSLVTVVPATPTAEEQDKVDGAGEYKASKDETAEDMPSKGATIKQVNPSVKKLLN